MTENQLKRQQAIDALRIAEIDLINGTRPLSQIIYNIEEAMVCVTSLMRTRKSDMKEEVEA
jgi:hypothetical protein